MWHVFVSNLREKYQVYGVNDTNSLPKYFPYYHPLIVHIIDRLLSNEFGFTKKNMPKNSSRNSKQ